MKTIALLETYLDRTPIGTQSRLGDALCGEPVLKRTVRRLESAKNLSGIVVACSSAQEGSVRALLKGTSAKIVKTNGAPPDYRSLITIARKWSLDAWRGGLGGSSGLDEYLDVRILLSVLDEFEADALAVLPPGSALVDPVFVDAMIDHTEANQDQVRLTFAQTPPGLAPVIMQRILCEQLKESNAPVGWAIAYKPDEPAIDLAFKQACFIASQALRHASGRLTADTHRSFRDMEAIIRCGADSSADATAHWLMDHERERFEDLPREVELELTIESPGSSRLHPAAENLKPRGPLDPNTVEKLALELAEFDDSLVVLGGVGDPVIHPAFCDIVRMLRESNVYGIAVQTTGQLLDDDAITAMIDHRVDVVEFKLDAWTPQCYADLTDGGELTKATDAIDRLVQARNNAKQAAPIIVPSLTKSTLNMHEMDAFFDGWLRKVGCALIGPFADFGGNLENLAVSDMRPPSRVPCRRLAHRCFVAADGSVLACDQDLHATVPLGHLGEQTLGQVWTGARRSRMQSCHETADFREFGMCEGCPHWNLP